MTEKDIKEVFKKLNITEKALSPNYTPDEFAKKLINENSMKEEVSYSINTTVTVSSKVIY